MCHWLSSSCSPQQLILCCVWLRGSFVLSILLALRSYSIYRLCLLFFPKYYVLLMAVAPTCCCSAIGRGHCRSSCRYGRGLSCGSLAPRRRLYRVLWHNVAIPLSNCCWFCLLYTSTSTHYILVHSPCSSTYFSSVLFWQLVAHWKQLLEAPLDTAKLLFFAEEEKRQQQLLAV